MVVSVDRSSGRVMVLADDNSGLDVPAIKVSGRWGVGTFSADDLKDNFNRVSDPKEADMFFQEAFAAFSSRP